MTSKLGITRFGSPVSDGEAMADPNFQPTREAKERKLAIDLAEDPAGLCPARCDTERYWGHSYVNGICEYCDRVEE